MKASIRLAVLLLAAAASSQAAFLSIDDSDSSTYTITVGDFEGGFAIYDGTTNHVLNAGLGQSASMTFSDGVLAQWFGRWIDLGQTASHTNQIYFGDVGTTVVQSVAQIGAYHDGQMGAVFGYFVAYNGNNLFPNPGVVPQDGHTEAGGFPFLSWSVTSENASAVPDHGATVPLLMAAVAGLALVRRRR